MVRTVGFEHARLYYNGLDRSLVASRMIVPVSQAAIEERRREREA